MDAGLSLDYQYRIRAGKFGNGLLQILWQGLHYCRMAKKKAAEQRQINMNARQRHEWAVRMYEMTARNYEAHTGKEWLHGKRERCIADLEKAARSRKTRAVVEHNLTVGSESFHEFIDKAAPKIWAMIDEIDVEKN